MDKNDIKKKYVSSSLRCKMCENYDRENDKCNEYEYEECSKMNFTRCEGYIVKDTLINF